MASGWRYRLASVTGVTLIGATAVVVANLDPVQTAFTALPLIGHLPFDQPHGAEFLFEAATATTALVAALVPLYKPRPRRTLTIAKLAVQRTLTACIALAAIGYFDYTYRLPRATLLIVTGVTLALIPAYFVAIRRRPSENGGRVLIVGDDPETILDTIEDVEGEVLGYVSPPVRPRERLGLQYADGGSRGEIGGLPCLGGLSQLEDVIVEQDFDTAVFAFSNTDREEFFGSLSICHDHGVAAKIHRDKADNVLMSLQPGEKIVDIDVEPWDWQDRAAKLLFDALFAGFGLLISVPIIVAIAAAVKLEDGGPILYSQKRTTEFGDTFRVYKFRSMTPESENDQPGEETSRVTSVGRFLRRIHLDELPQLWSILAGDMSVVGPRAAWVDEERVIEQEVSEWRQRWFVKPGLTGLAQINKVNSEQPRAKLRYDIEYIRHQSFRMDVAIIFRQIGIVLKDVVATVSKRTAEDG